MDVATVIAAVGSSTLIATGASAFVSWKVANRQHEAERERLALERDKLDHDREKYDHEKLARKRDGARNLCQQVIDELSFMAAAMQLLHDNWRIWEDRRGADDDSVKVQTKQLYDDLTGINARMPRLISDLGAGPFDVLPDVAWRELTQGLVETHQTYGRIVLAALNPGTYPDGAWRSWLLEYGRANMMARRFLSEIS